MYELFRRAKDGIDGWVHWRKDEIGLYNRIFYKESEKIDDVDERQQYKRKYEKEIANLKYQNNRFVKAIVFSILVNLYVFVIWDIWYAAMCFVILFAMPCILYIFQSDSHDDKYPIGQISEMALKRKVYTDGVWAITLAIIVVGGIIAKLYYGEEPGSTYSE